MLRAHTVGGWDYLAQLAEEIGAGLLLVVHEPEPCPMKTRLLRLAGVRVAAPRLLQLTTDRRALEVGIPPVESWLLDPSIRTLWLPEVPAWPPIRRRVGALQGTPRLAGPQEVSVVGRFY